MSKTHIIEFNCPQCGEAHDFTIWDSINTVINPEMKEKVLDYSAFEFECPDCGAKTVVCYDFLYHQMDDHIMIYLVNLDENIPSIINAIKMVDFANENIPDKDLKLFEDLVKKTFKETKTRIVRDHFELHEKINIFDNKLDDRLVEMIKLMILEKFLEENDSSNKIDIFFGEIVNDELRFQINTDEEFNTIVSFPIDLYNQLKEMYQPYLDNLDEDQFLINRDWAFTISQNL